MSLPYENSTSGDRAVNDMQKILASFGCASFGHMMDFENGELLVQFKYQERQVSVKASIRGYAASWLKHHPHSQRMRKSKIDHEREAMRIGSMAVYSICRDWIKGQVTAVECGILSFEAVFLPYMLTSDGRPLIERVNVSNLMIGASA